MLGPPKLRCLDRPITVSLEDLVPAGMLDRWRYTRRRAAREHGLELEPVDAANLPALLAVLPGCELADVPVLVLTIDPCISCTER